MSHRTKHQRWIFSFVAIILALAIATPVLADYIGPNRTVSETQTSCRIVLNECQYVPAKDDYRFKNTDSWSCSNESKPWQAYPNDPPRDCSASTVGDEYWSREESTRTVTITYPPATIDGSLQNCTLQNGWCTTDPYLALSGSEPIAGQSIFAIEGDLNGQPFGCTSSSCNVPLRQGNNYLSYWALSTFLDSSEMGSFSARVDSQPPNLAGAFTGTTGSGGWYVSPISFNGSASDAASGLASFTCSLDGIYLASCNTITVNTDGFHTLVLTAQDNAGHTRAISQNASIDTQNPALNASISGTLGSNNWYTNALLSATASDPSPGSGLSVLEYSLDGSGWATFPLSGTLNLSEGKHTVDLRALDQAGRTVSSSKSFWLDRVAPGLTLDTAGTIGLNEWYITNLTLTASASDKTSGVDVFDYSLDHGGWQAYTTPLRLGDGAHNVSIWAQDAAGLVTQIDRVYQVDTRLPQIAGSLSGTPGENGWYVSPVTLTVSASDPTPGSGMDSFTYILDESAETSYSNRLLLSDGQHNIQFNAKDKAGLSYSTEQNVKVDTIPPSLNVETTFRDWVKDSLTLKGIADDDSSGVSKVEISIDGAQTWQSMTSADENVWNYTWDTLKSADGVYQVDVRATDVAGLRTQHTFDVGIDNRVPEITLPEFWFQWDTVTLDIWDSHSGLSEARVEITDPEGRWPKRVIQLNPKQFPLSFKWDRRFGDDTVAEPGDYEVTVIASDSLGNTTTRNASIKILLDILPPGPTATLQPYIRVEPTDIPRHVTSPTPSLLTTQIPVVSTFGVIEPTTSVTPTPQALPTPRATPTQSNVQDWLQSVFVPDIHQESVTEIDAIEESIGTQKRSTGTENSAVLWGTAATAAIAAATAYAQEEKRKREEEKARQAQLEAREEERRRKGKQRKLEKIEAKRQQELAWEQAREEARLEQKKLEERKNAVTLALDNKRIERLEAQEETNWIASQEAIRNRYEEKKKKEEEKKKAEEKARELKAGLGAYNNSEKQGEKSVAAPPAKKTWWDKTKSFVSENIIEPVNTHIFEPYIKPAIELRAEIGASVSSWLDENIYQPHIKPTVERNKEFISNEFAWINEKLVKPIGTRVSEVATSIGAWTNEKIYQPYIKPAVEKTIQDVSSDIKWLNEKIYQPYIQPAIDVINEKVYQPYIKPVVNKVNEAVTKTVQWVDKNIYQPYLEPVVSDINQYIYQPLANKVTNWWDEYGEWVHGALDAVGFVPGLGEIADGLNGLVYLAEGRYLEASLSAVAMIPILGDLGKAGKWALNSVDTVVEKVVKEVAEDAIQKVANELIEEGAEKVLRETTEELIEKSVNEAGGELIEKVTTETLEEGTEKVIKAVLNDTIVEEATEEVLEEASKEATQRVLNEVVAGKVTKLPADISEKLTAETASELAAKISEELGGKNVWVSAKTGSIYVSSPPAEGFLLAEQLSKTDLTKKDEVEKILKRVAELTSRGSGDHVVLGPFGSNGRFIQEALDTDGVFWDVGDDLWEALDKTGIDMFDANDQFLHVQIENGIDRFDVIETNVNKVINDLNKNPSKDWSQIRYTEKEILDLASMPDIPYQLLENSWVRTDLINNIN